MRRREFITLIGASTIALPGAAGAQQPEGRPVIGWLATASSESWTALVDAFRDGLRGQGFGIVPQIAVSDLEAEELPGYHRNIDQDVPPRSSCPARVPACPIRSTRRSVNCLKFID